MAWLWVRRREKVRGITTPPPNPSKLILTFRKARREKGEGGRRWKEPEESDDLWDELWWIRKFEERRRGGLKHPALKRLRLSLGEKICVHNWILSIFAQFQLRLRMVNHASTGKRSSGVNQNLWCDHVIFQCIRLDFYHCWIVISPSLQTNWVFLIHSDSLGSVWVVSEHRPCLYLDVKWRGLARMGEMGDGERQTVLLHWRQLRKLTLVQGACLFSVQASAQSGWISATLEIPA